MRLACVASVSVRLSTFLAAGKLGRAQKSAWRVALAPIFAQPNSEKRLQRAESPTETLATQAIMRLKNVLIG